MSFDFDDDFLLDDDLDGELDRDAAIERFEAEVSQKMKLILTRKADASARREAVYWLGESGSPKAITALRKVYQGEKDPKIRKAAAYALGQFKALDEAIERDPGEPVAEALGKPENAWISDMLVEIAVFDARGRRKRIRPRMLWIIQGVLVLTVAGLIAAGVLLDGEDDDGTAVAGADDPIVLMQDRLDAMRGDVNMLRGQFNGVLAGNSVDCSLMLRRPVQIEITPEIAANAELQGLATSMNATIGILGSITAAYTSACDATAPVPIDDSTATNAVLALDPMLENDIPRFQARIDELVSATPVPPPTEEIVVEGETLTPAAPTAIPETPTPTVEPPTPIPSSVINEERRQLLSIITTVTEPRGALLLLRQHWTDAGATGTTGGCNQAQPTIPEDHALPVEIGTAYPELQTAADRINDIGLTLLRQSWERFFNACAAGTLQAEAEIGLTMITTAEGAFEQAQTTLQTFTP